MPPEKTPEKSKKEISFQWWFLFEKKANSVCFFIYFGSQKKSRRPKNKNPLNFKQKLTENTNFEALSGSLILFRAYYNTINFSLSQLGFFSFKQAVNHFDYKSGIFCFRSDHFLYIKQRMCLHFWGAPYFLQRTLLIFASKHCKQKLHIMNCDVIEKVALLSKW